jgi:hypothetical protein
VSDADHPRIVVSFSHHPAYASSTASAAIVPTLKVEPASPDSTPHLEVTVIQPSPSPTWAKADEQHHPASSTSSLAGQSSASRS